MQGFIILQAKPLLFTPIHYETYLHLCALLALN